MSKKRAKSGGSAGGGNKWEAGLMNAVFEEDTWKPEVVLLVGNSLDDYSNLDMMGDVVNSGVRRLFSLVSKKELYEQVKDLGNPKSKKSKETPAHYEVCEPCKTLLDNNEDIPLNLLAKLLKFKLLHVKQNDLNRRANEKKAAADKEKGKKGDKKERGKSAKKGGKKTPEPPSAKQGSKLRKRGEVDDSDKYIDDEPDDGADHYILVYGFNHPHLIGQLAESGINVSCIIKMESESYERFEPPPVPALEENQLPPPEKDEKILAPRSSRASGRPTKKIAAEEETRLLKEKETQELATFWKDILPILRAGSASMQDVARLHYIVKQSMVPNDLADNENKTNFGTEMFEDVACMVYDLLDFRRQYKNYLNNLKLYHVQVFGEPPYVPPTGETQSTASAPPAKEEKKDKGKEKAKVEEPVDFDLTEDFPTEVDMRYYNDLMSQIPNESVSVPLVMHCMLEQIVATEQEKEPPSERAPEPRSDGLDTGLADHLSKIAFNLVLSDEEQQLLAGEFKAPEPKRKPPVQPRLLNQADKISVRCEHLKELNGFDPKKAELDMLKFLPFYNLSSLPSPSAQLAKQRAARLQELIHFCSTGGLTQAEVDRAFKQFVFECMNLMEPTEDGVIRTSKISQEPVSIPWDDPYPAFLGDPEIDITPEEVEEEPAVDPRSGAEGTTPRPTSASSQSEGMAVIPTPAEVDGSVSGVSVLSDTAASSGILRMPGSQSRPNSVNSVHFDGNKSPEPEEESMPVEIDIKETMSQVVAARKRDLTEWCYAEHCEPNVLMQVIEKASYVYQYIDTYYHKRDHSLLVMLHNPYNRDRRNHSIWHQELFSNVGFRNYLEHIAELIYEWTKGEEARYEAEQLTSELDKIKAAEDALKVTPKSPKKKERGKSASKKSSRASSQERAPTTDPNAPFIRPNSLKAYKIELERMKKEQEEEERLKQEKLRAKSAKGKDSAGADDRKSKKGKKEEEDKNNKKKPGSRAGSAKSRNSVNKEDSMEQIIPMVEVEEPFWPFHGYNTGNNLIQSSGIVTNLFPTDGGVIRMERYDFVQATVGVRMSVLKDGHTFNVHVVDPKDELNIPEKEKSETEAPEKTVPAEGTDENTDAVDENAEVTIVLPETSEPEKPVLGSFSSFSACMSDGMCMAFSAYGNTGTTPDGVKYVPEAYIPPPPRSPSPGPTKDSPTKGRKGDKAKSEKSAPTPDIPLEEDLKDEEPIEETCLKQDFQQLFVTCPDGLSVRFLLDSQAGAPIVNESERNLLVRQSYVSKTSGQQACEKARLHPAMDEASRIINNEGTVIKTMQDGSIVVLFADGTMSKMTGNFVPKNEITPRSTTRASSAKSEGDGTTTPRRGRKGKGGDKGSKNDLTESLAGDSDKTGTWVTTTASGEKIVTKADGSLESSERNVLVAYATDPETRETVTTREDHVIIVTRPDGTFIVEHEDGTRITTCYRPIQQPLDEDSMNETGEVPEQLVNLVKFIKVECPGFATVEFNAESNHCCTMFGTGSYILVNPTGSYFMSHYDGGRMDINQDGTVVYRPKPDNELDWSMAPQNEHCYVIRHHDENICETMDNEGNTYCVKYSGDTQVLTLEGDKVEDEERVVMYKKHAPRFFIIHADGSGTELQRFQDLAEYLYDAEHDPHTAILKEPLQDFPGVFGITIMKPYKGGPSERWFSKYEESNILPAGLKSRDLHTLPPVEEKKPGPVFGTDVGCGLAVGSAPKNMPRIDAPKCPSTLELRQVVQYQFVTDELRVQLENGLQEFVEFAKSRREETDDLLEKDPRSEEERMLASDLNDLVLQDVLCNKAESDIKGLYEQVTAPPVPSPPPTPAPKRTQADWDRDQRELAEEYEGRKALRHHEVPPYFHSELGKAFLLTQAKDMPAMIANLAEDPRTDGTQAIRGMEKSSLSARTDNETVYPASERSTSSSPQTQTRATTRATIQSRSSPFAQDGTSAITPSNLRPGNPTPAHALGQGSPAPVRPHNPTPLHAGKTAEESTANPTPRQADTETPSSYRSPSNYPSIPEQTIPEENQDYTIPPSTDPQFGVRSLQINAVGDPRTMPVHIPAYMNNSGRPKAQQNIKFAVTEDMVRRKVKTASIAGATMNGKQELARLRGLELMPAFVDFGLLREGYTYGFTVFLKNTGVDLCRYNVKQPPPSTGITVIFNPGPVAAGMKAQLNIEIYSIAVGVEGDNGVGSIEHDLEVVTETDIIYLPITAVMTSHEFDQRMSAIQAVKPGVKLLSTQPPASRGIIRPRKEQNPYQMIQA